MKTSQEKDVAEERHPHSKWQSAGDLMMDLILGTTPRPFWICWPKYRHRVTDESAKAVAAGLRLSLEFQTHRDL